MSVIQNVYFYNPSSITTLQSQVAALQNTVITESQTNTIQFYLNESLVTISNPDPTMTLVDYLRYQTPYKGVKQHCRQGGCGVCAVMISYYDQSDATYRNLSVNSCLRLLVNCDGCAIITTEGIKISPYQYHPTQERIAKTYGIQCGACTTAQVMTQYVTLQQGNFMQRNQYQFLEKNFDGNLCRCSCYPGIIKMARSFLPPDLAGSPQVYNNSNNSSTGTLLGWDLNATGPGSASQTNDDGFYSALGSYATGAGPGVNNVYSYNQLNPKGFILYNTGTDKNATSNTTIRNWLQTYPTTLSGVYFNSTLKNVNYYRAVSLSGAISRIQELSLTGAAIVSDATSYGVPGYARPTGKSFVDINHVEILNTYNVTSTGAFFGAGVPINKLVSTMFSGASSNPKFNAIADHLFYISGNHVRNVASWCGGLVMSKNGGFASDMTPVMIAANATLTCTYIYTGSYTDNVTLTVEQYLNEPETDKFILIKSIFIPGNNSNEVFWSFRLAQRYFNSHAWLNVATSYTLTGNTIGNSRVVFGGLISTGCNGVARSTGAETALNGQSIASAATGATGTMNTIISSAISGIASDIYSLIAPIQAFNGVGGDGKVAFRRNLSNTLWYMSFLNLLKSKGYLSQYPKLVESLENWISGVNNSDRIPNVEYAFFNNSITSSYPLYNSWPKLDALQIASGEVRYNDDIPSQPGQLWAAFATSTIAVGAVDWDSSTTINSLAAARATPGVEYVITVAEFLDARQKINNENLFNYLGYSTTYYTNAANVGTPTNIIMSNQSSQNTFMELFGNQFIRYYGQRIAMVLSQDAEIANTVAQGMEFGYKNQYTGYSTNLVDAVNTGKLMNNSTLTTSTYGGSNAAAWQKSNILIPLWPNTGAPINQYTPLELLNGTISVGPTGVNGQTLAGFQDFTGPSGWVKTGAAYYTIGGNNFPRSEFILQSTGARTAEKMHMYLERNTANCYRDENGVYNVYCASQNHAPAAFGQIKGATGLTDYQIRLAVKRIAGGYGGKLTYNAVPAIIYTLIACYIAGGRMIRYVPSIQEDSNFNGGETEMWIPYRVGFDSDAKINNVYFEVYGGSNYAVNPTWRSNRDQDNATGYLGTPQDMAGTYFDPCKNLLMANAQDFLGFYVSPKIASYPRPQRCSYRGPFYSPNVYAFGSVLDDVAGYLDLRINDVAEKNLAQEIWWQPSTTNVPTGSDRNVWQSMIDYLQNTYDYTGSVQSIDLYNSQNKYVKRGIASIFGKYEVFSNNRENKDVMIRITSQGEIYYYPGTAEMGQGAIVKGCEVIASILECPISMIRVPDSYDHMWNFGACDGAGSKGSTLITTSTADAAYKAKAALSYWLTGAANGDVYAQNLYNVTGASNIGYIPLANANLSAAMTGFNGLGNVASWKSLCASAISGWETIPTGPYPAGVNGAPPGYQLNNLRSIRSASNGLVFIGNSVNSTGPFTNQDKSNLTQAYDVYSACISEVEVNMLSGNVQILSTEIIVDAGKTTNPSIDVGQAYGGYIFGLGAVFKEERTWDSNMKPLISDTWDYKPPCSVDIPQTFNISFFGQETGAYAQLDYPTPFGAKSVNELTVQAAQSAFFAAKDAIRAFRKQENGNNLSARVFELTQPATPDRIQAAAGLTSGMLNVNNST